MMRERIEENGPYGPNGQCAQLRRFIAVYQRLSAFISEKLLENETHRLWLNR